MNRWFKKLQTRLQDRVKQWLGINSVSVRIAANAIVSDARYHVIENKLGELERAIQAQAESIDLAAAKRHVELLEIVTRIDKALTNAHAYDKQRPWSRAELMSFEEVQAIQLATAIAEDADRKDSN